VIVDIQVEYLARLIDERHLAIAIAGNCYRRTQDKSACRTEYPAHQKFLNSVALAR
jgi:hypothetical protein